MIGLALESILERESAKDVPYAARPANAMTVDVEDYFQVTALAGAIPRSRWDSIPLRVKDNTLRILDLFDRHDVKATFFILGWVAERCPEIVQEIARRGHETACHGYGHQLIYEIGPERFREDIRRAKALIEDITGRPALGYRAPSYSITRKSLWALDILVEEGFVFDSSVFPTRHDTYGIPDAPFRPHAMRLEAGELLEFPPSTTPVRLFGRDARLPVGGGGYLRLFPLRLTKAGLRRIHDDGTPAAVYVHPWEVDPGQPRVACGLKSRFRHYVNLDKTERRLGRLLETFRFMPMGALLEEIFDRPVCNASRSPSLEGVA